MKGKIAIATMVGQNQGNRLQNYALQYILEGLTGKTVETLRVGYGPSHSKRLVKAALRYVQPKRKWARFAEFDHDHIRMSKWAIFDQDLDESGYELYFIGSDQVWNPTFGFTSDFEYLPQIPKEKKSSYAASFGVDEIVEDRERKGKLLSQIGHLSVREDAAKAIVRDLCGAEAEVVLDPTMLLSAEEWRAIEKKPSMDISSQGYILKYVLGDNIDDDRVRRAAGLPHFPIIDLKDKALPVGPAEFVWLVSNAVFVCTDSFHASAFSILLHTPFAIFERISADKDMSCRFDTLCGTFGLEDRRVGGGCAKPLDTDWSAVDANLDAARCRSFAFLRSCVDDSIAH